MCTTDEEIKVGTETANFTTNTFAPGLTIEDFWKLETKPVLTKEGVYKKPDHDDVDRSFRAGFMDEENEERKKVPRRVIPNNEVDRFVEQFWPKSELNREEARAMIQMFFEHAKKKSNPGYMSKGQFKRFIFGTLNIYDPFICERMFLIFDSNHDEFIDYVVWANGMHTILVGSIHEQLKYCFRMYDVKKRGVLDKDDLYFWIKRSYFNLSPMTDVQRAEYYEDIYKLVLDRFVGGNDNRISFRQYRAAVCERPSVMEIPGNIMPDTEAVWKLNDIIFPRFFRSKYLMLFPRGDVPRDRDVKFDPARLIDHFAPTELCYPPNYTKGIDSRPMLKNAPASMVVKPKADDKVTEDKNEEKAKKLVKQERRAK